MNGHIKKISRLLYKDNTDIDQHNKNISSYGLSFFQKLALCRGLNFALPQRVSSKDIQAAVEKAFWKLEPDLSEDNKELAAATLRSIALWLDDKLKPLSDNEHTVTDIFGFVDDLQNIQVDDHSILVSYDVSSLFTNVPVDETIKILAEKAFKDDWFNKEHGLHIMKADLVELLNIATKNQLFQFEGNLYEQVDGLAMGSPRGPLMANAFMCSTEERLLNQSKMPNFYKRYVDDTFSIMPNVKTTEAFLSTLNDSHPSISFTMELATNGKLPFLGVEIVKHMSRLETKVYKKPTDTGLLLLHYQSHVDVRYKQSLLKTMLNRAFKLSSNWQLSHLECERLRETFSRLRYPVPLLQSTVRDFVTAKVSGDVTSKQTCDDKKAPVRIILPFKDQRSANSVRRQLGELSRKIGKDIHPVYTSRKTGSNIKPKESKPLL